MMQVYADTSFLFSLYVRDDNTERAKALIPLFRQTIPLTPLHRLELRSILAQYVYRFGQGERRRSMDHAVAGGVWANIETDAHGVFSGGQSLDWLAVVTEAKRLTVQHAAHTGTGSLDTLHIAAAVSLGAQTFVSFDNKQRALAKLAGFTVLD